MSDPIEALLALSKAGATGGKYYKRVPKGGGKKGYNYFYTNAAYEKKHGESAGLIRESDVMDWTSLEDALLQFETSRDLQDPELIRAFVRNARGEK